VTDKEEFLESENARLRVLLTQAGLDAAASDVANKLQRLLLSEMHHRVKNLLAMVQSIVLQSLHSARTPLDAVEVVTARISALARAHDIILSNTREGSPLKMLFADITAPFGPGRFRIDVPAVEISSRAAVSLALVINELATNAVKYGALSSPDGSVVIAGRTDAAARDLIITWTEEGGPAVNDPDFRGFGTKLIQVALPSEPILEFRSAGVFCEMKVPLPTYPAKGSV
jgi:two-component sensor histidine kinase